MLGIEVKRYNRKSKPSHFSNKVKIEVGNDKRDFSSSESNDKDRVIFKSERILRKKDDDVFELLSDIKAKYQTTDKNDCDKQIEDIEHTPCTQKKLIKMFRKICKGNKQSKNVKSEVEVGSSPTA